MRLPVARLLLTACALLAVVPATAGAATAPKVTSVAPLKLKIGERLTIRGKGFLPGKNRNTVVFKAAGERAVFAKAQTATTTKLVVKVPAKLAPFLKVTAGQATATRFQLRVLARKLSPSYTPTDQSPVISPVAATATSPTATTPAAAAAAAAAAAPAQSGPVLSEYERCQAAATANPAGDQDADGLPTSTETAHHLDPCVADSDSDGMVDGYEYEVAQQLNDNGSSLKYPGTGPWPRPWAATDGSEDFDGDGLTISQEYRLWWFKGHHFPVTEYSDGKQASGGRQPVDADHPATLDLDNNQALTDDERDADGDGLSNVVELKIRGIQSWWKAELDENPYTLRPFDELDPTAKDSDGDEKPDGADDQDVDGFSNLDEMQKVRGTIDDDHTTPYIVDPYNPCMPNPHSDTCSRYTPVGAGSDTWRPFNSSALRGRALPFLNAATDPPGWTGDTWDGKPGNPQN
jgi:IPT/TIG domain-containing protein